MVETYLKEEDKKVVTNYQRKNQDIRLKKQKDFDLVFNKGKRIYAKTLTLVFVESKELKFGISLSKKFGKSVKRNRIKRLLRASFRNFLKDLNKLAIKRVRFTTSHPRDLDDATIDAMALGGNIMPHLHLPVQSGNNRVLKAMNRKYTREDYLDKIKKLKEKVPGISITTDIIVGFPGETEEDFLDTMDVVDKVKAIETTVEKNEETENKYYALSVGLVPSATYFTIRKDDNKIVGLFKIRHYLNDFLRNGPGHMGYAILPDERGKGYAKKGLQLAIEECKNLILEDEIYFSVIKSNPASSKVILSCGGYIFEENEKEYLLRIKLPNKNKTK